MFRVDLSQNRLSRLSQKRFSDLNLRERGHLQEWLANQPDALGEELLIIQKEFDGFSETRERLDLLALDKDGRLVVIENKLDDSGRDVAWQALKYTAYVSGLNKSQIIDIYQQYIDRYYGGGSAVAQLCEFLSVEDLAEISLNPNNDQRIFFIAANFRREVTATVLWLISRGIDIKCFKVTPWSWADELIVDIQQIIPTPEAADFMITMATKDGEEKAAQDTLKHRHKVRLEFWAQTIARLRADGVLLYQNVSPTKDNGLSASSGLSGSRYVLVFSQKDIRVELIIERSDRQENKRLFDLLYQQRDTIEAAFGAPLEWERLDDIKRCIIVYTQAFDAYERDNWPTMIAWLSQHIQKFEAAFRGPLATLGQSNRITD